ncbi:MAG TPA: hypothetical protein VH877_16930 [Polyangia bacterium]|jgi:hypothetical protein|nr:hypothetical protein [Polyangia bacterium]
MSARHSHHPRPAHRAPQDPLRRWQIALLGVLAGGACCLALWGYDVNGPTRIEHGTVVGIEESVQVQVRRNGETARSTTPLYVVETDEGKRDTVAGAFSYVEGIQRGDQVFVLVSHGRLSRQLIIRKILRRDWPATPGAAAPVATGQRPRLP